LDKNTRSERIYTVFNAAYPAGADGQYPVHREEDLESTMATNWRTRAALADILQFPKDMLNFLHVVELQVCLSPQTRARAFVTILVFLGLANTCL